MVAALAEVTGRAARGPPGGLALRGAALLTFGHWLRGSGCPSFMANHSDLP